MRKDSPRFAPTIDRRLTARHAVRETGSRLSATRFERKGDRLQLAVVAHWPAP
jgi:hypothetical protein